MKNRNILNLLVFLLILVIAFGTAPEALAKLKATSAFYIWDDTDLKFNHSIAALHLDGNETNVIHELGFDNDPYDPNEATTRAMCDKVAALESLPETDPNYGKWRENCLDARTTSYAGVMELGVPYEKIEAAGIAHAFDYTLEWSLIDCDLNKDLSWNNLDLVVDTVANRPALLANWDTLTQPSPPTVGDFPSGMTQRDFFKVLAIDVVTSCTTGNCSKELVTTIFIDLDINGDDQLTALEDGLPADASGALPGGCVCFYAKAFPITWPTTPPSAVWGGNPQARITAGGGDKTVNFDLLGPTVISLDKFSALSPGGIAAPVLLAIVLLIAGIAVVLIRESRIHVRR